jgi:hypothetical protein
MKATTVREKIIEEIKLIPEDKLSELYRLVHHLRLQSEPLSDRSEEIMTFAGCWQDIPEEEFEQFYSEIAERRRASSARRQHLEACDG